MSTDPVRTTQPVKPVLQTKDTAACAPMDSRVVIVNKVSTNASTSSSVQLKLVCKLLLRNRTKNRKSVTKA